MIELCFEESEECDETILEAVKELLSNFEAICEKTFEKIGIDFRNGGEVRRLIEGR